MGTYVRIILIIWLAIRKETGVPQKSAGFLYSSAQKDTSSNSAVNEAHLDIQL